MGAERTKGPWKTDDGEDHIIVNSDGVEIADCGWNDFSLGERRANAAFIVRAANSHEELVAALQGLVADVQDYAPWQRPCHALDVARAAIQLATA